MSERIVESPESTELRRRTYMAFRAGAMLRDNEVASLLQTRGHELTPNRLRSLGRDSDRGASITPQELYDLVSAWAHETR